MTDPAEQMYRRGSFLILKAAALAQQGRTAEALDAADEAEALINRHATENN